MLEIQPLQSHQIEQTRDVILSCLEEVFGLSRGEFGYDSFDDLNEFETHYFGNGGTFLVLLNEEDSNRVVGTGAIRRLDMTTCELKRMYLLPQFRGQGSGEKLANTLLDFARTQGYKRVRLDLGRAAQQIAALRLYERLGFKPIERYNDGPCEIFMEKVL